MKKFFGVLLLLAIFSISANGASKPVKLNNTTDSLSYFYAKMIGVGVAEELSKGPDSAKINKDEVIRGFKSIMNVDTSNVSYLRGIELANAFKSMLKELKQRDNIVLNENLFLDQFFAAFLDKNSQNPQELQPTVMALMTKLSTESKAKEIAANKAKEVAFFAELLTDASVKKTPSGVCYKILAEGNGKVFNPNDKILIKYEGRHLNGEVFDKTKDAPVPMSPSQVIPGFGEVLKLMSPGAYYVIFIPADLAYGDKGAGPIKPGETIIFEVEATGSMPSAPAEKASKK